MHLLSGVLYSMLLLLALQRWSTKIIFSNGIDATKFERMCHISYEVLTQNVVNRNEVFCIQIYQILYYV